MSQQNVIIIGNTTMAEIVYSYLEQDDRYTPVAFAVDQQYISQKSLYNLPIVDIKELANTYSSETHKFIVAVGYQNQNKTRETLYNRLKEIGYKPLSYIHPTVAVSNHATLGEGIMVFANSVVEPFTTLEEQAIVWANCTIGHHATMRKCSWIAANSVLAGESEVGAFSFLGVNVTVANKVKVAPYNIIGSHAHITRCTSENEVHLARGAEKHRFSATDYAQYFLK